MREPRKYCIYTVQPENESLCFGCHYINVENKWETFYTFSPSEGPRCYMLNVTDQIGMY